MATKHFCDICSEEISTNNKVNLWSAKMDFQSLCFNCWSYAEVALRKRRKKITLQKVTPQKN